MVRVNGDYVVHTRGTYPTTFNMTARFVTLELYSYIYNVLSYFGRVKGVGGHCNLLGVSVYSLL